MVTCVLTSIGCAAPNLSAQPSGETHTIEISGLKFTPENVDAKPGDTITWINRDFVPHTATSKDGSWDTGVLMKDESKSIVVTQQMTSDYFCTYHPGMTATITTESK